MKPELRKTGISVVGDVPWGTHFCHFYETKQDLLDTLIPYFKAGLESNEFCVWVVSDSDLLSVAGAKAALARAVPDLDRHLSDGNIEILKALGWYLDESIFNLERVTSAWEAKLERALTLGYDGMRVSGDTLWLAEKDWKDFCAYEKQLNDSIADRHMNVLCTYPLPKAGAAEVLDVVQVHQFATARRQGEWEVIETPGLIQAQAEIRRLNEQLEQRVSERTDELVAANEALKNEITERRRIEEELRERAADLTEAQRVAKIGNWILDLRTNKVNWSEQLYRIFGIEARDFDGHYESFVSRIHPDDRPRVLQMSAQAKIGGLPFDIEYRIIAPNDEVRIIREIGYAAQDETGNVIRLFGTAQDITDRKLVERALDERLRFETLLTELSAAFANLPTNEVDHEIDKWLQSLVEFLGVDRASFFQFGEDWTTLYRSHSYTVSGIEPLPSPPIGMKDQFPWITDQLRRGITVKWSRIPDDMPEEAAKEKEYAARLGVKSGLNIPVRMGGSVICAITFTSLVNYRDWPDAMVARLRLVGEIFAAAVERKRAEAALRKSEEQFRQMAENIREVFWLTTADLTRMLYISPAYEVVWGQSRESLYLEPRSFFTAIHAEDRSRVVSIIERDREQGFEVEYRVVRPDGTIRSIRDRGFPIRDESGRFYRVAGIAEDITEPKHAEALLHAKEQEFRAIVENAPDQIIRYDREFRRTYVNPAVLKAYGLPAESLIGKPIGSVIQDAALDVKVDELARLRQVIAAVFDTGKLDEYEMSWPALAGRRYYSVRFFPELDLNGSVVNVLGISRDITERRIAEEELKKEKEVLEKIFDNIPVMIGFVGDDGRVKLVNPEWERTIGWTLKELEEQNVDIFAEAYPDPAYRQEVLDFVTASTGEWVDLKIRVRTGQVIDAACAVVHLSDGTRVAIAQDITERKRSEERIRATSEQLRALSAKLQSAKEEEDIRIAREIHDEMGSTLTSLRWDLERFDIVISEAEDWSQLQELRPKIAEMMRLTDITIGTMRRIASELRPSILDDLGLPEALEWQAQQFQTRTGIVCRCECSLENLEFDPDKSTAIFRIFQEALTNILSHAEATTVDVVARSDDGEFVLTISDNGKGITEDEKSSRLSLGILGMRERAHLIGGKLEISGINGRGTVLTVRIPNLR
jgi:PAS domain S-box-containing protein